MKEHYQNMQEKVNFSLYFLFKTTKTRFIPCTFSDELISSSSNKLFSIPGKWVGHALKSAYFFGVSSVKTREKAANKGNDILSEWYESAVLEDSLRK